MPQGAQERIGFLDRHALFAALDRVHDDKPLGQRRGVRVDRQNFSLGEFLLQLVRGNFARSVRAADTGGHAHKQNILPRLQHRMEIVHKALRRDLRGRDLLAVSHRGIERLRVERGRIHTRLLTGLGVEREGDDGNILGLQIGGREVRGRIGHNAKHNIASFYVIYYIRLTHFYYNVNRYIHPLLLAFACRYCYNRRERCV